MRDVLITTIPYKIYIVTTSHLLDIGGIYICNTGYTTLGRQYYAAMAFRTSFVSISLFSRVDTKHLRTSSPTAFASGGGTALPT